MCQRDLPSLTFAITWNVTLLIFWVQNKLKQLFQEKRSTYWKSIGKVLCVYVFMCMCIRSLSTGFTVEVPTSNDVSSKTIFFKVYYLYLIFDDAFCGWSSLGLTNNVCCAKILCLLSKILIFLLQWFALYVCHSFRDIVFRNIVKALTQLTILTKGLETVLLVDLDAGIGFCNRVRKVLKMLGFN